MFTPTKPKNGSYDWPVVPSVNDPAGTKEHKVLTSAGEKGKQTGSRIIKERLIPAHLWMLIHLFNKRQQSEFLTCTFVSSAGDVTLKMHCVKTNNESVVG